MVGVFHDEIAIRTLADHRFEMQSKQMVPVGDSGKGLCG